MKNSGYFIKHIKIGTPLNLRVCALSKEWEFIPVATADVNNVAFFNTVEQLRNHAAKNERIYRCGITIGFLQRGQPLNSLANDF